MSPRHRFDYYGNYVIKYGMSKSGKRLIAAAKEAVAIARGEKKPASIRCNIADRRPRESAKSGDDAEIRWREIT